MNNLYLIIGEDNKLIEFELNNILSKIDETNTDKITFDMTENSLSTIIDECSIISMFANKKIVIANNFDISKMTDDDREYLDKYINSINKNNYIILITQKVDARVKNYKIFKDNFKIIELNKFNNHDELINYIKNKIKESGYKTNDAVIEYFLSRVGNDINNINNELTKLFIYKEDTKELNMSDVELLTIDTIDNIIYEFTNAILEKDYSKITKMYDDFQKENVSFEYLLSSIYGAIRQALIIKVLHEEGKTNADISKTIGKKEFYVKKMLERTYMYTTEDLGNYIIKLADIDYNFKTGKSNLLDLELFLLS